MSLKTRTRETAVEAELAGRPTLQIPEGARILIVCDDDSAAERLEALFREAGFSWEAAISITEACEAARSGRFQVVVSVPMMRDGSWRRLIDVANHYDLGFEVVLLARNFDLPEWAEALKDGAFNVLYTLHELPKAGEVVKRALWAAYLKGAGPPPRSRSKAASPQKAA